MRFSEYAACYTNIPFDDDHITNKIRCAYELLISNILVCEDSGSKEGNDYLQEFNIKQQRNRDGVSTVTPVKISETRLVSPCTTLISYAFELQIFR